jgi:3-oxoacyl-[acyl-carrier-protein] synthase-3
MEISLYGFEMLNLRIVSTGKALPRQRVTSGQLDVLLGQRPGYVEGKSGIFYRHTASATESQSGLAAQALLDAFARAGLKPGQAELLIAACGVQEQALPNTASRILEAAGFPAGVPGIDVNASCLSFMAALTHAGALIQAGVYRRIAIVSADLPSRGVNWDEPEASLIFGDGAASAIVERGNAGQGIRAQCFETYPEGKELCEVRAGGTRRNPRSGIEDADFLFRMNGKGVFKLASKIVPKFLDRLLESAGIPIEGVDVLVPHQASHLGMQHMLKKVGVPQSRVINIYPIHGNQVAASVPTALHAAYEQGLAKPGANVLLLGTAAGLTVGGMVITL